MEVPTGVCVRIRCGVLGRHVLSFAIAAMSVAAMHPVAVSAQTDTVVLTLAEALQVAEETNPTYRRARNNTSLNAVSSRTTWFDQILPRANLTLFTQFRGNLQRQGTDPLGNPIRDPDADWVYFSNTTQRLNLTWSIQGRSLFQALDRQALENEAGKLLRWLPAPRWTLRSSAST